METEKRPAKSLLLVEDNISFGHRALRDLEAAFRMPVVWTKTLAETRSVLKDAGTGYEAAVLDFVLPDAMNGEIIEAVAAQGLPSIVFTGSINPDIREFVWSKKVVDYILKDDPSSMEYLVSCIRKLMANRDKKILLVDDSAFFRKAISELLYVQQYQLVTATNATDALDALERYPGIDLVITDFNMPGMDGCRLCRVIRETRKKDDLAIIGISSEGDKTMAAQFIKSGANDFIVKQSFIREEFYCRVSQCLENIDLIRQTKRAAIMDFLTGLYNRRYFFDEGEKQFGSALKAGRSLACVMLDIDHFKAVNDTYGHDIGDRVLCRVSDLLKQAAGDTDLVARIGGEEFCFLVCSSLEADPEEQRPFQVLMEEKFNRLRVRIQETAIELDDTGRTLSVTVSMGLVINTGSDFAQLLKHADERLYFAKENGRNRVATTFV